MNFSPPSSWPELFDLPGLLDRCLNDAAFAAELLNFFESRAQELVTLLVRQLQDGDWSAAGGSAHALAGSAGNAGAIGLEALARQVERLATSPEAGPAQELAEPLQRLWASYRQTLPDLKKTLLAQNRAP